MTFGQSMRPPNAPRQRGQQQEPGRERILTEMTRHPLYVDFCPTGSKMETTHHDELTGKDETVAQAIERMNSLQRADAKRVFEAALKIVDINDSKYDGARQVLAALNDYKKPSAE